LSSRLTVRLAQLLLVLSMLALTFTIVLRGIIMGAVPLANGYDTMLFVAWMALLVTTVVTFAVRSMSMLACAFGFLLSGFFLLVSHLNVMDPSIGHLMPVLRSPLLSIHVSIIMFSFALLALTFVCGVAGLLMRSHERELQVLSLLFLYPALTTLGLGIFVGAVWANVSWGNYWTWDPKETWALITFMVYAVAVHRESVRQLARPHAYHWFTTLAFLTLIMTYFGVNFFLQGMHSYA
jgi:ABC-type transport system involved in cytochrome c biogenesis permease subunit